MNTYGFHKLHINHLDDASEHFHTHDNYMAIQGGENGCLDYSKQICFLGGSFLSTSMSNSGWSYQTSNEIDGFVVTIAHAGGVEWKTHFGKYRIGNGAIVLLDQRNVFSSTYLPNTKYTTLYLSNFDICKQLTMMLGIPPKTRVYFNEYRPTKEQIGIIQTFATLIFDLMANTKHPPQKITDSLKESLLGYVLHSFPNNYTRMLIDENNIVLPTPHSIKIAAQYMIDNSDPDLTVGEVAAMAGMSVRSLQNGFKRYKGITPILFLRNARIKKARSILLSKAASSPRSVARECGFLNYQLFCKYYFQAFFEHPASTIIKSS